VTQAPRHLSAATADDASVTAQGSWSALATVGVIGGVLSGLFAIGGSILMVPLLMWRGHFDQRRASATSLAAIMPTAVVSSAAYLFHGQVDVLAAAVIAIGAAVGTAMGSALLKRIPILALRWMFIVFILVVAVRLVFLTPQRGQQVSLSVGIVVGYIALGLLMGVASGLFGIGGSIIAIPLLISFFSVSDLVAKGTALLVTIPTSVVGTVSNRRAGLVDIRAGLTIGVAAAVTAIPAVELAQILSPRHSAELFALLLVLIAGQMIYKTIRATRARQRAGGGSVLEPGRS
jgi:uncharacterized protein